MMIKFSLKIVFKTFEPISQETALEMSKLGSHFMSVKGTDGRTYQLTATGQSMTLTDAISVLVAAIKKNVENDGNWRNNAQVQSIEGRVE